MHVEVHGSRGLSWVKAGASIEEWVETEDRDMHVEVHGSRGLSWVKAGASIEEWVETEDRDMHWVGGGHAWVARGVLGEGRSFYRGMGGDRGQGYALGGWWACMGREGCPG